MLCELHIKNLAIIKDLSLILGYGFSILTGETGAGKSIILQSLGLLSGGKGKGNMVRSGTSQAVIEAIFTINPDSPIPSILDNSGFDTDEELIIKRIISNVLDSYLILIQPYLNTTYQLIHPTAESYPTYSIISATALTPHLQIREVWSRMGLCVSTPRRMDWCSCRCNIN